MIIFCEKPHIAEMKTAVSAEISKSTVKKENTCPWFETCSPQYVFLIVLLVAAIFISFTTLVLFLTTIKPRDVSRTSVPIFERDVVIRQNHQNEDDLTAIEYHSETPLNLTSATNVTITTRDEWLAQSPKQLSFLSLPVPLVIIMHTATANCSVRQACLFAVRAIQNYHINNRHWSDIGYNFLVGGDGSIYEGRGWNRQGAHTYGYNKKSIGIALIGNFNKMMPTDKQICVAKELIQLGVKGGYITPNYKLFGARQLQATESPGSMLYEDLQKWTHWTKDERDINT